MGFAFMNNSFSKQLSLITGLILSLFVLLSFSSAALSASSEAEKERGKLSDYWQEAGKHFNLACENGSDFKALSDKILDLKIGTFLIESQGGLELKLPQSVIDMPGKAMILVRIERDGSERVYCLFESVAVSSAKREIQLRCGDEVLLSDHVPKGHELVGEYEVMVRQLRSTALTEKLQVTTMEFSIVQAMLREPLLNHVSHSDHPHDRVLKSRLLKSAAIFQMFPSRGQYFLPQ